MTIEERIEEFIGQLSLDDFKILRYVYNKDFVPGETPVYYSGPYWDKKEITAAIEALLTGKWISSGEHVKLFENRFARKINQHHAVMVNSGSSANLVMIAALKKEFGWKDGDEVIVSAVGFPTTIAPIVQNNLVPRFADIEWGTLNFELYDAEDEGLVNSRTVAIFVSPVLGNPPNMDEVFYLCDKYGLTLILDSCDSLGSKWDGKFLHEYASASSFSFYPAHHISTGEGGMVTSNLEEIVKTARSMAWWGRDCYCVGSANLLPCGTCNKRFDNWLPNYDGVVDHKYVFTNMGYNLKPLDLQGAIGLVQLEKLDEIHERRKNSFRRMSEIFSAISGVRVAEALPKADVSWFGTPVICKDGQLKKRLVAYLEDNKIQTRNYFAGNILLHPGYKHLGNYEDFFYANRVLDEVFFVGAAPHYEEPVFEYVSGVVREFK